ncbi:MAG TPA: class I SAM-dependent methyltransferase [Armatimonadetes bacterium]|nr:class I SAM-dependent methyltransferase [Armatimonadota bacterium]
MQSWNEEQWAWRYEAWYEQGPGYQAASREKALLQRLLAKLGPVKTVLEVGCGTGYFTRWLAAQGLQAVGLDLSAAMLAVAQAKGATVGYLRGDATALPFDDETFDLVAFITTLEFIASPMTALREAARVAKRGLLLGVLNRFSWTAFRRCVRGLFRATIYRQARFYSVRDLIRLVHQALPRRRFTLAWDTTAGSVHLLWGEFIGLSVRFEERE